MFCCSLLSQMDWNRDRPITEYYQDLKLISMDRELQFLIQIVRNYDDDMKKEVYSSTSELCVDFQIKNPGFNTSPVKFGTKLKKYGIEGLVGKNTKKCKMWTFDIEKCMDWFIRKGHIQIDDLPVEPIDDSPIEVQQGEEEERLSDMLRNPNTKLAYNV